MRPYRHTQIGWVTLLGLGAAWVLSIRILWLKGQALAWMAVLLFGLLLVLFGWLTVRVTDEFLSFHFGIGLIRKRFPLSEIVSATSVRSHWYWGFGIRWTPRGWLYNVSGLDAVELELRNGTRCRIGTDQPDRLLAALDHIRHPRPAK